MRCPFDKYIEERFICMLFTDMSFSSVSPCIIENNGNLVCSRYPRKPCDLIVNRFSFHPKGKSAKEIKKLLQKLHFVYLLEK